MRRKAAVACAVACLMLGGGAVSDPLAQARYPKQILRVATHSSPGGGSDVFLREMAPHLSRIMGVTVVVENQQGGSSARAMATLARAKPDGGLLYATTPTFIYTSLLSKPGPFRKVVKDYFLICESYYAAIKKLSPSQIEALDMGRRGLHNEGSELLRERLDGKIEIDLDTARRLFTLICALHITS